MSLRCQSWVYENSEATGNERLILLAIADEADDDGTNAYPGIDRIARKARVNKRTTMRCIERLEEAGRLVVKRPEVSGRGHHNTYVVVMDEKGDTLTTEKARKGDKRARNGALPYLDGSRPVDPQTQDPKVKDPSAAVATEKPAKKRGYSDEAHDIARSFWEERATKPVCGFPALRTRIQEALDAGHSAKDVAAALPRMPAFSRNAFDFALRGKGGSRTADNAMQSNPRYWEEP